MIKVFVNYQVLRLNYKAKGQRGLSSPNFSCGRTKTYFQGLFSTAMKDFKFV